MEGMSVYMNEYGMELSNAHVLSQLFTLFISVESGINMQNLHASKFYSRFRSVHIPFVHTCLSLPPSLPSFLPSFLPSIQLFFQCHVNTENGCRCWSLCCDQSPSSLGQPYWFKTVTVSNNIQHQFIIFNNIQEHHKQLIFRYNNYINTGKQLTPTAQLERIWATFNITVQPTNGTGPMLE